MSKAILEERARRLAQPLRRETMSECMEVVEFSLGSEKYAIESVWVREVYPLKESTLIPCTPPFVLGVVNVRGQVLVVLDIRKLFGLQDAESNQSNKIIILHDAQRTGLDCGIAVDTLLGVRSLPVHEIQEPPSTLSGAPLEYLRGVATGPTAILNVARLLAAEEIIVRAEAER